MLLLGFLLLVGRVKRFTEFYIKVIIIIMMMMMMMMMTMMMMMMMKLLIGVFILNNPSAVSSCEVWNRETSRGLGRLIKLR